MVGGFHFKSKVRRKKSEGVRARLLLTECLALALMRLTMNFTEIG